jgi:hypothetical protein
MNPIPIEDKGIVWLVYPDGSIWSSPDTVEMSRTRFGKVQTFVREVPSQKLSPYISKSGYHVVACMRGGKRVKVFAHRLIARAFVPGYEPHLSVNHINGNKLDNRPENLEWLTVSDNSKHEWETGLIDLRGENQPGHKLSQKQVIHIRKALRLGVPANSLAIIAGVNPSTIYLIEWGKRWTHLDESSISY